MILEVNKLNFGYLGEVLLKDVTFRLLQNDRLGLVGVNGSGKSTLLNLISYKIAVDSGEIEWDKNYSFSYLDQHLEVKNDLSIIEYLNNTYTQLFEKENEMNSLYDSLSNVNPSKYDNIISKAERIMTFLEENEFYMIKSKVYNIINGLGIDLDINRKLKDLSSGQRCKVFLGKMLLEEKDVLLLDEPTNFLDVIHIEWLTKFLNNYKYPYIVISHDTTFLNNVCNGILAIQNKTIYKYPGNYQKYLILKEEQDKQYEKNYKKQVTYIKKTEEFISKNIVRASTTKRAQSRQKELSKITVLEKPTKNRTYKFHFPFTSSFNSEALICKKLEIGYTNSLLDPIDFNIYFKDRIVITGANGVGKTTFLKTILNIIPQISGKFKFSSYNDLLYYNQEYAGPLDITPYQFFKEDYPNLDDVFIYKTLGRYGINRELAIKKFSELSGGEMCKVRFSKLSLTHSNILILDEPTNHLDKYAKDALVEAIEEYPGTVIIVSHEKEFYRKLNMKEIPFKRKKL